jgi:hypothetical protein
VNPKLLTAVLLLLSILSGCSTTPSEGYRVVDVRSQIRSMVYTQRELLALELANDVAASNERYTSLLRSYCDLYNREFIPTNSPPQCDAPESRDTRGCIASFHACVGLCDIKTGQCTSCEGILVSCLNTT